MFAPQLTGVYLAGATRTIISAQCLRYHPHRHQAGEHPRLRGRLHRGQDGGPGRLPTQTRPQTSWLCRSEEYQTSQFVSANVWKSLFIPLSSSPVRRPLKPPI